MVIGAFLTVALLAFAQADKVCPDNKQQCDGEHTCCHLAAEVAGSQWGCCPFANGICCEDGYTCCPSDHSCVPGKRACVPNTAGVSDSNAAEHVLPPFDEFETVAARRKLFGRSNGQVHHFELPTEVKPETASGILLPTSPREASANCSSAETSCTASTCCPLPEAVCCSNGRHCCPSTMTCDLTVARCVAGSGDKAIQLPLYTQFTPQAEDKLPEPESTDVPCGNQSSCSDGNTCCKLAGGCYGCCPLPNAVCCSDQEHCCPSGTTCDTQHSRCVQGEDVFVSWFSKQPAKHVTAKVVCPDKQSQCPDGSTCCVLASGEYGCCPLENAVCCEDKEHCCPQNTQCDVTHSRCIQADGDLLSWFSKFAAKKVAKEVEVKNVVCPDKQSSCPDGSTCCVLQSGQYGCCPLENAVCCDDKEHCCPQNTKCDVEHSRCIQADGNAVSWYLKFAAKSSAKDVVCPDKQSSCPDGSTCCVLASGQYGCCPLQNAVCCDDKQHCCPENTKCDVSHSRCIQSDGSYTAWANKFHAHRA